MPSPNDLAHYYQRKKLESHPSCYGKMRYPTQLEAAKALFHITAVRQIEGREQRAYPCGNHWHLTSQPKKGSDCND